MNCKIWYLLSWGMMLLGCALLIASYYALLNWGIKAAGLALFLAGAVLNSAKCRCPTCRQRVSSWAALRSNQCPHCGSSLN